MKDLQLGKGFALPADCATEAIAILAKRRAGKSFTARRFAEQLHKSGQQTIIVDPKGDWWGIRSAADGKSPGLPIVILGGEHGDAPLEVQAGEVVAKLAVHERVSMLLDLSTFRKHEVCTFMTAFLEQLYRMKATEQYRTPVMLIIDEADAIAPQKPMPDQMRMLGAADDIVRRGGQRGIGCTMITQRSAVLNKDLLTQVQILIALRTIAPQDLKAIQAWIDVHGTQEERTLLMENLPSLPIGDAYFWSPGWPTDKGIFKRTHVLPIETFDSGATPKAGQRQQRPKQLAAVDLEALKRQMSDTLERAKADDPKVLRAEIAKLKAELSAKSNVTPINVEVAMAFDRKHLERMLEPIKQVRDMALALNGASKRLIVSHTDLSSSYQAILAELDKHPKPQRTKPNGSIIRPVGGLRQMELARGSQLASIPFTAPDFAGGNQGIPKCPRALLAVLSARYPKTTTDSMLSLMSRYSIRSSGFGNGLSTLRTSGYIEGDRNALLATQAGMKANGPVVPFPVGNELIAYWVKNLPRAPGVLFQVLQRRYPTPLTKEEMSKDSEIYVENGYSVTSSGFGNALSTLRTLELIRSPEKNTFTLNEELFG